MRGAHGWLLSSGTYDGNVFETERAMDANKPRAQVSRVPTSFHRDVGLNHGSYST
jgi:hypothetical protein